MSFEKFNSFKLNKLQSEHLDDFNKFQNRNAIEELLQEYADYLIKEVPEMLANKLAEYEEYKEAHSGYYVMTQDSLEWSHDRAHYNDHGNEVIFMTVQGSNRNETIRMNRNTHDIIWTEGGLDTVYSRWGNDFIDGGDGCGLATIMYGGSGDDTIVGYNGDNAYGESGNDRLIGYGHVNMYGGTGSDTFELRQRNGQQLTPKVRDLSHFDRVIVKFEDDRSFERVIPADDGNTYVILDSRNDEVGRLNIESLEGFNIRPSHDGAVLRITGSEFSF